MASLRNYLKLLILLYFTGRISSESPETYQELLSTLKDPSKLVFDITRHAKKFDSDNFLSSQLNLHSSPLTYYRFKQKAGKFFNYNADINGQGEVSILYTTPRNKDSFTIPKILDEIAGNLTTAWDSPPTVILADFLQIDEQFVKFFMSKLRRLNLKFGGTLSADHSFHVIPEDFINVNYVILDTQKFRFANETILNPTLFSKFIQNRAATIALIKRINPNCTFYLHVYNNPPTSQEMNVWQTLNPQRGLINDQLFKTRYFYTLQSIIKFLNEEENNNFGVIFDSFPKVDFDRNGFNGVDVENILAPFSSFYILEPNKRQEVNKLISRENPVSSSQVAIYLYAHPDRPLDFHDYLFKVAQAFQKLRELSFVFPLDCDQLPVLIKMLRGLPLRLIEPDCRIFGEDFEVNSFATKGVVQETGDRLIDETRCYFIGEYTSEQCSRIVNEIKSIEFYIELISINLHYGDEYKSFEWGKHLLASISSVFKIFPKAKIRFNLIENYLTFKYAPPLYCLTKPETETMDQTLSVLVNFCRIYNVSIKLQKVLKLGNSLQDSVLEEGSSWWAPLNVLKEVNVSNFLPFMARGYYPKEFLRTEFSADPCIIKTTAVKKGLSLDKEFTGTTVDLREISSSGELRTMLGFVFHKFSLVEIVARSEANFKSVLSLLSDGNFLKNNVKSDVETYLEITSAVLQKNEVNAIKRRILKGVHTSKPELLAFNSLKSLKQSGIKIGILLEDCLQEVNGGFQRIKSYPEGKLDYVVCQIKKEINSRRELTPTAIESYLDTHLYIRKYFHSRFPNQTTEFFFRLEFDFFRIINKHMEHVVVENFLKFVGDLTQYAKAYQIKFLFPAFDHPTDNKFGWWKIQNSEDLKNTSSYTEKEAEFLGKDSWRPVLEPNNAENSQTWIIVLILSSAAVVLLITVSGLLFLRARYKKANEFMSENDLERFMNGVPPTTQNPCDLEFLNYEDRAFPREYELGKSAFDLSDSTQIIGRGNFGVVHKTTLSCPIEGRGWAEGDEIAVKVPKVQAGTSDVAFKSILSEIKILCYVGRHPNVVSFVGAYIQEIRKGVIFVATELCERGDLLKYLKTKQFPSGANEENDQVTELTPELTRLSIEIARGMEYISKKKILHGDLSARNVLLDKDLTCKIADFGFSRKLNEYQEYSKKSSEALPWKWMALESLRHLKFSSKSDVWSFGVTVWEIFSLGAVPYPGKTWSLEFIDELENGLRLPVPRYGSEELYQILLQCWKNDPKDRSDFTEIVNSLASLKNVDYTDVCEKV